MSTAPRRPDLANEPVGRLMLRLSIPTITAQLVNMLYNLVDRIYISYIPDVGTLALTGLGVCLPIILWFRRSRRCAHPAGRRLRPSPWGSGTTRRQREFWAAARRCCCAFRQC